jgi:hypothetical protein
VPTAGSGDRLTEARGSRSTSFLLPRYDESGWPILLVRMPPVALSDRDFEAHLDACTARYRRGEPFCMLFDMGDHPPLGASRRRAVAERMVADARRYPGIMLGCALVVRSDVSKGGVTAINWVARPPYEFTPFVDMHAARTWLTELLERHRGRATR